ncbi:MAG: hypothetical protein ACOCTM_04285, partial [Bacteroidota bacterium]
AGFSRNLIPPPSGGGVFNVIGYTQKSQRQALSRATFSNIARSGEGRKILQGISNRISDGKADPGSCRLVSIGRNDQQKENNQGHDNNDNQL